MYKNILVPVDGSPLARNASNEAVAVAKEQGARVVGFYVAPEYQPNVYADFVPASFISPKEYEDMVKTTAEKYLAAVQKMAQAGQVPCTVAYGMSDLPYEEIVKATQRYKCDLIFMASCEVIGTEISDTAEKFPHTIQWDFHDTRPEWLVSTDFIFSNAFDHTYDPERGLNAWMSCLKKGGVCIIEHTSSHDPSGASELDPFGADIVQMPYLITKWGDGKYCVRQFIEAQKKKNRQKYCYFIVIQRL